MRNGTRERLVPLAPDEQVPVELQIGRERIEVWLDQRGIHFRQEDGPAREGLLPWDLAIAMSLVPGEWQRRALAT